MTFRVRLRGAWSHAAYRRYWAAFTLSSVGSTMAAYAMPMVVVVTLHGGAQETARLIVWQSVGAIVGALASGLLVKPRGGRRVMIAADAVRFLAQGSVPVLFLAGALALWPLYTAAFLVALCSSFFGVAQAVVLPGLVAESEIADANAKLWFGVGVSLVAGPILSGVLANAAGPPYVIGLDALTYVASAMTIMRLPVGGPTQGIASMEAPRGTIVESFAWSLRQPSLLALFACRLGVSAFTGLSGTVAMYYRLEDLRLSPALIGLLGTLTSPGFVGGPAIAGVLLRRLGPGRVAFAGALLLGLGSIALPAARGNLLAVSAVLVLGGILADVGSMAYQAMNQALLQTIVPVGRRPQAAALDNLLAELGGVAGPVAGSVLASSLPAVTILWIGCVGLILSPLPMALTHLVSRRTESSLGLAGGPASTGS